MADDPLHGLCTTAAAAIVDDQGQRLASQATIELVATALRYVRQGCQGKDCDSRCAGGKTPSADCQERIPRVVQNYQRFGAMVSAMLAPSALADDTAWEQWRQYILALAHRKGLTEDDAQDLTQQTYLQLRKALRTFRFESQLHTFCWNVFGNCYLQRQREHGRIAVHEIPLTLPEDDEGAVGERELADPSPAPEVRISDREARGEIEAELASMLNSTDLLILRWYYLGKGPVEHAKVTDKVIGQYLGLSLMDVTNRRHAALRRLRRSPVLRECWAQMSFLDQPEEGA